MPRHHLPAPNRLRVSEPHVAGRPHTAAGPNVSKACFFGLCECAVMLARRALYPVPLIAVAHHEALRKTSPTRRPDLILRYVSLLSKSDFRRRLNDDSGWFMRISLRSLPLRLYRQLWAVDFAQLSLLLPT